jgi:Uma2 family endonuclease
MTVQQEAPAPASLPKMTYEEFLAWADEDTYAEWVDGDVIWMSPVSKEHADLNGFLLALIRFFVEAHQSGVVYSDPFQMKTGPDLPGRAPDILFVATENLPRIRQNYLEGPGDLVVEIISPESVTRDRRDKFGEYERGGVGEYWLLDPIRRQADFYGRGEDGGYRPLPVGEDGVFRSVALPGLWLRVDWLWQRPLPALLGVLREWGLV